MALAALFLSAVLPRARVSGQAAKAPVVPLSVDAGATCVRPDSLQSQVSAWLGERTLDPELQVSVEGSDVDPRDVSFYLRRGEQPVATRRFSPAPFVCAQLEATLALAIAMALQASLREELLEDLGGEAPTAPARERATTLSLLVRTGAELLPRRAYGGGVTFTREFAARFGLRAGVFVDGARNARLPSARGRFHALLLSAQLSGCALFPVRPSFRVRTCLGCALGPLRAKGRGYTGARTDWLAWVAVTQELGVSLRLSGPLWLDVPVGLVVPTNEVGFELKDGSGQPTNRRSLAVLALTVGLATQLRF